MIRFLRILGWLVVLGVVALLAFIFAPAHTTGPTETLAADWQPEPGQGKAAFNAGDCAACHTAPGGTPLAGGLAVATPFGDIWSTNITPDKQTGIGNWTLDQFRAAMVDGIAPGGRHLYPAMPYENYRFLSEGDIRALYGYLMNDVAPVSSKVPETKLAFPFNLRFGIRAWNWLALRHGAGPQPSGKSPEQDRGQYLVEGAGHCAACHSPRNDMMMQDGVRADQASFLSGGAAPSLRGPNSASQLWSVSNMAAYLATGRNAVSAANGGMGEVVFHSLQWMPDRDIIAMAAFLRGLDGEVGALPDSVAPRGPLAEPDAPADDAGRATAEMLTEASPDMALGARLYLDNCAACHFVTGRGAPGIFPALQGNGMVVGPSSRPLINVILRGAEVPGTEKRPMTLVMQGHGTRLSDDEVAALVTFLRQAWGNNASAITAADVHALRAPAN